MGVACSKKEIVSLLSKDVPKPQRRVAMKALETVIGPCPMVVSFCIDPGTALLSLENGRFPIFQPHFAMTLLRKAE